MMGRRTQLLMSIAATLAGLSLLLSLFLSSAPVNPAGAFLAALLFAGGVLALWTRAKTEKSKKVATGPGPVVQGAGTIDSPKESVGDDFLAQFVKKTEDPSKKTETEGLPTKSEADEFLAQFLKK
jgi:hypothetical protein